MKITDAIRLGHVNVKAQFRRSLMIIIVIGVAFSLVFALNFMVQGLKDGLLRIMNKPADGKVLLLTDIARKRTQNGDEVIITVDGAKEKRVAVEVGRAGGEILGEMLMAGNGLTALPKEILAPEIEVDLGKVPEGVTPVLPSYSMASYWAKISIPVQTKPERKLRIREDVKEAMLGKIHDYGIIGEIMVVGMMPSPAGVSSLAIGPGDDLNPLNILLQMVGVGGNEVFAVQDEDEGDAKTSGWMLASFPNAEKAKAYVMSEGICFAMLSACQGGDAGVMEVFGAPVSTLFWIEVAQTVVNVISVILVVVALVIMFFTVLRLIGQNSRTIALYHAMGATRKDVALIYLMYVLELCLLAAGVGIMIGLGVALGMSWANGEALSMAINLAYDAPGEKLWLVGWSWNNLLVVGLMLAMAPICILLSYGQFSDKKLAKRLKA